MFKKKLIDPEKGSISLRGFVIQRNGYYVAACLELCLAAQDETKEGARQKLHEQVLDYLADAFEDRNFEMRPAPLEQWLTYYRIKAKCKIREHMPKTASEFANTAGALFKEKVRLQMNSQAA